MQSVPVPYDESPIEIIGRIADEKARQRLLATYQESKSPETLRRQKADLTLFQSYLLEKHKLMLQPHALYTNVQEWHGITFGLVEGFKEWQKEKGYALTSINVRVATIRIYADIATRSGVISLLAGSAIQGVKGYTKNIARNVDEKRPAEKRRRPEAKKAQPTRITATHLRALKEMLEQDHTYLGYRDMLLMCLLGLQGFRCGEVAMLQVSHVNLEEGKITIYRHKVNKTYVHEMAPATLWAVRRYLVTVKPAGYLFEGVSHSEAVKGLSTRAINLRIRQLGERVGISALSPHDLRHYWTADLFNRETPIEIVKNAGGWSSYTMPEHYRGHVEIANKGVKQTQW